MFSSPMERCLEVLVSSTHETRIGGQEALDDRLVAVSGGLEDRGCVIHADPRRNSVIIVRPGADPASCAASVLYRGQALRRTRPAPTKPAPGRGPRLGSRVRLEHVGARTPPCGAGACLERKHQALLHRLPNQAPAAGAACGARASIKPAMLEQAISSRKAAAPSSASIGVLVSPAMKSEKGTRNILEIEAFE